MYKKKDENSRYYVSLELGSLNFYLWIHWKQECVCINRIENERERKKNHLRVYLCLLDDWRMTIGLSIHKAICVSIEYAL